ncbi:hypothetical protein [Bacillus bombysepticus]|uniref:hypothetical protein n=1 Tax=Bacillus bombysepticus TaxID=658666 RepID=UPI003017E2E7
MDYLLNLFSNKPMQVMLIIAIVIVIVFVGARFIGSLLHTVMFILLLGGLLFVLKSVAPSTFDWIPSKEPSVTNIATLPLDTKNQIIETKVKPYLENEIQQAKATKEADGTYTVTSPHMTIKGNVANAEMKVKWGEYPEFSFQDEIIKSMIQPLLQ